MSREAMQMALEALEDYVEEYGPHEKDSGAAYAIKALRQALEKPKYRRGDRLLCLETEEYCVIHIRGTDRQYVKFPDGHIGEYTNEQVGEHFELLPKEVDADDTRPQARSLTDELMDCVDRLGSEADTVDPRVWQHLLVYAPKHEKDPVAWADAIIDDLQGLFDTDGITEQDSGDALIRLSDAIAAVEDEKKRYTAPQKQEPVAWMFVNEDGECEQIEYGPVFDDPAVTPLYTAPPKREWQGLTDEEIHQAFCYVEYTTPNDWNKDPESWCIANAKYLQAILKEKNHG